MAHSSVWNSLEIAKLVVAAAIPVAVGGLGYYFHRAIQRIEHAQWANRKLVEWRLGLYQTMAPDINDLLCFFRLVGQFRDVTPPEALERKRRLDKEFHVNQVLFSDTFVDAYGGFMSLCFATYQGSATDALLRADCARQAKERRNWNKKWDAMFVQHGDVSPVREIGRAYELLMGQFAVEVGAGNGAGG